MCDTVIRLKISEKVKFGTDYRNFCSITKLLLFSIFLALPFPNLEILVNVTVFDMLGLF